jgi:acetyl esterase
VSGVPEALAARIRGRGAVVDVPFVASLYEPLLAAQPRDGVKVTRDLSYGSDARHRLDVYQPQSAAAGLPVMLFLPGGGFVRGDKSQKDNIGHYFARQGVLAVVANYRLAPAHVWPAGAEDAVAAYQWTRARAAQYGGDLSRLVLVGESAGAAHVASASLIRRFQPPEGLAIAGVVLISGVYNVQLEKRARRQFGIASPDPINEAYFGSDFARYPSMSTVELIDAAPLPLLLTFAELDLLQMQVQAGELFARLVGRHGFDPELRMIRDHNHLTQVFAVNTGDESLSAPLLEFIRAR